MVRVHSGLPFFPHHQRCASRAYIASKRFFIPEMESRLYTFSWVKRGLR